MRVVRLIGRFARGPERHAILRSILLDARQPPDVREQAVVATWTDAHRLTLSREELVRLAHEGGRREPPLSAPGRLPLTLSLVFFAIALEPEAEAFAGELLRHQPPEVRTSLLTNLLPGALTPRLVEAVFRQWWDEDRPRLEASGTEGDADSMGFVARAQRHRPGVWDLLVRWARRLEVTPLRSWVLHPLSADEQRRLLRSHPDLHRRGVEALLLPLEDLLEARGEAGLLKVLGAHLHTDSQAWKLGAGLVPHPEPLDAAVSLLATWPGARKLFHQRLSSFAVATPTRRLLVRALFEHDRPMALRWALVAERYPDNLPLVGEVLRLAARAPMADDRSFFLRWLHAEGAWLQAWALEGLLGLEESGEAWRARLQVLLRSDHPRVQLRAATGLVREGIHDGLALLRQTAAGSADPLLRAEAIHWLGLVDAEASRPLLHRAVVAPRLPRRDEDLYIRGAARTDLVPAPEAEEAACVLDRLGAPGDLAHLLEARLRGTCDSVFDDALAHQLDREEGHAAPPAPRSWAPRGGWNEGPASDDDFP
ncbi:HEAT repeat domain-containing protein [Myxococcus sp. K15C18031901]|uniref:HEAT repeat domain-containing protein n=1 Tax=Myxococcus dinghuensis TaxID=2906761 RepID=UPI0020A80405|nr:HEAT repeat domain-containing protein [Myxococcus dinghuensis]MCP3102294.1 HEAT repeat domain-containing protein [Myxococcus dinghuensis]